MRFSTFEYRSRVKYVEKIQAAVIRNLKVEKVAQGLGEYTSKLLELTEGIYIPNIKKGSISIPEGYRDSDFTPVVGIAPGETLHADWTISSMSPIQIEKMQRELDKTQIIHKGIRSSITAKSLNTFLANFAIASGEVPIELPNESDGFCLTAIANYMPTPEYKCRFIGRSLLVIGMYDRTTIDNGIVLSHELTHVAQSQDSPIVPFEENSYLDKRLRDELEAHYVGVRYGDALVDAADDSNYIYSASKRIDRLREMTTQENDRFNIVDPVARKALARMTGVDSINRGYSQIE